MVLNHGHKEQREHGDADASPQARKLCLQEVVRASACVELVHSLAHEPVIMGELVREQHLQPAVHEELVLFVKWTVLICLMHTVAEGLHTVIVLIFQHCHGASVIGYSC
jgi:hypothetical protein